MTKALACVTNVDSKYVVRLSLASGKLSGCALCSKKQPEMSVDVPVLVDNDLCICERR